MFISQNGKLQSATNRFRVKVLRTHLNEDSNHRRRLLDFNKSIPDSQRSCHSPHIYYLLLGKLSNQFFENLRIGKQIINTLIDSQMAGESKTMDTCRKECNE
jgi:hypothetical protein